MFAFADFFPFLLLASQRKKLFFASLFVSLSIYCMFYIVIRERLFG